MYSAFRRERVRGYYDCLINQEYFDNILRIVNFGDYAMANFIFYGNDIVVWNILF